MPRYSETLLKHAREPKNGGAMEEATAVGRSNLQGKAPYTTLYLAVTPGGTVQSASFETFGCGVSIAACSALTELITGQAVDSCRKIAVEDVIEALDGVPADKRFCIDLALSAFHDALANINTEVS